MRDSQIDDDDNDNDNDVDQTTAFTTANALTSIVTEETNSPRCSPIHIWIKRAPLHVRLVTAPSLHIKVARRYLQIANSYEVTIRWAQVSWWDSVTQVFMYIYIYVWELKAKCSLAVSVDFYICGCVIVEYWVFESVLVSNRLGTF